VPLGRETESLERLAVFWQVNDSPGSPEHGLFVRDDQGEPLQAAKFGVPNWLAHQPVKAWD
jgi:hypothetical protein